MLHYGLARAAHIMALLGGVIIFVVGVLDLIGVHVLSFASPVVLSGIRPAWLWILMGIIAKALADRARILFQQLY